MAVPSVHELSALDQLMPRIYTRRLLFFPLTSSPAPSLSTLTNIFQTSLDSLSARHPILAAKVVQTTSPTGRVRFAVSFPSPSPSNKIEFKTCDLTHSYPYTYAQIRESGFEFARLDDKLLSPVGFLPDPEDARVLAMQLTLIEGGLILCVATHHSVLDGGATETVVRLLAEGCRQAGDELSSTRDAAVELAMCPMKQVQTDRTPLMHGLPSPVKPHTEYKIIERAPGSKTIVVPNLANLPPVHTRIFTFSPASVTALKNAAQPTSCDNSSKAQGVQWISRNDAVSALMWRSITRARFGTIAADLQSPQGYEDEGIALLPTSSTLGFCISGRTKLSPPLPPGYLGNVVLYATPTLPLSTLLDPSLSLSEVAIPVRKSLKDVDDTHIRSVISFVNRIEDITTISPGLGAFLMNGVGLSSWAGQGFYTWDWGHTIGKVERLRLVPAPLEALCYIMPLLADGSIEVVVGLREEDMQRLEEEPGLRVFVV